MREGCWLEAHSGDSKSLLITELWYSGQGVSKMWWPTRFLPWLTLRLRSFCLNKKNKHKFSKVMTTKQYPFNGYLPQFPFCVRIFNSRYFGLKWLKEKGLVESSGNLISVMVGKMQERWSVKKLVYFLYGRYLISRKTRSVKAVQRRLGCTVT